MAQATLLGNLFFMLSQFPSFRKMLLLGILGSTISHHYGQIDFGYYSENHPFVAGNSFTYSYAGVLYTWILVTDEEARLERNGSWDDVVYNWTTRLGNLPRQQGPKCHILEISLKEKSPNADVFTFCGEKLNVTVYSNYRRGRMLVGFPRKAETIRSDFLSQEQIIQKFIDDRTGGFLPKQEFEKHSDFQARLAANRQKEALLREEAEAHFTSFVEKAFIQSINNLRSQPAGFADLSIYDSESEQFQVQFGDFGTVILNVPIDEAKAFKENYRVESFMPNSARFELQEGSFALARIEYFLALPDGNLRKYRAEMPSTSKPKKENSETLDSSTTVPKESNEQTDNTESIESQSDNQVMFNKTNSIRSINALAVIPKEGTNCSGQVVSGDDLAVIGETSMLGLYTVVDRKFFEQTMEEIRLSMSGLTFENGVLEAGCIENAQGYLFVEHGCLQNKETIKAKLIHCESSEIIWNALGQGTTASETFSEIEMRLKPH